MNDKDRNELLRIRKRAEASIARIEAAEQKESEWAEAHDVEPSPVQPLTEVPADLVAAAIGDITGDVSQEAGEVLNVYRKSLVRAKGLKVSLDSRQLLMILDAAGVNDAPEPAPTPPPA